MAYLPTGFGLWCAYPTVLGGWQKAGALALSLGAQWIAPRAGMSGWDRKMLHEADLDLLLQMFGEGGVFPWPYLTPGPAAEAQDCIDLIKAGATGLILDAEVEWSNHKSSVQPLIDTIRAGTGDAFVGYSSYDYPNFHPEFPFLEFSALDGNFPQIYAFEHDDQGHIHHWLATSAAWQAWEKANGVTTPRYPIGCTYRPAVRGGKPVPPRPDIDVPADVVAFLNAVKPATAAYSLYTLEAANPAVRSAIGAWDQGG